MGGRKRFREDQVKVILMTTISGRMQLRARDEAMDTAAKIWKMLLTEHQDKSELVESRLLSQLQDLRCPEGGDIMAHLTKMLEMRENLRPGNPSSNP